MRKKLSIAFGVCVAVFITWVVFFNGTLTQAQTGFEKIQYPVEELGNCQNEQACRKHCDDPKNADKCLDFAVKNGLMSSQDVEIARKFLKKEIKGPGGCNSKETCEKYCDDISHIKECISFAEENNLIPPDELREFKQVQAALERGVKPPKCKNKKDCELYCEDPSNIKECIAFGKEAGFLHGDELRDAEKMLSAIERGVKPPPCRGRGDCKQYCSAPQNMEMCLNFALEAGFMEEREKAEAEKMLAAVRRGVKPLPCADREECDAYCSDEGHIEECISFATEAGFMTQEEAEMARKTGGKGPGGCKGREECEAFCKNPDNQQTCFDFAKEHGMVSEEDARRMEEGRQQVNRALQNAPPAVMECLRNAVGAEAFEKMQDGQAPASQEIGEKIRRCFEENQPKMPQQGPDGQLRRDGGFQCQTPEECEKFRSMKEEEMRQRPPEGAYPEEYKKQYEEQYRQQYEEQKRMMEEQIRSQQEQQIQQAPNQEAPKAESREFRSTIIGALFYGLLNLLVK